MPGASVDVWQANDDGFYDVQQPGVQPERNLRGLFTADDDGRFWFRSIVPRHYPIPADGPVGELLDRTARHPYRPAHLHFLVRARLPAGHHARFVADSPYLDTDAVFGVKESLVREIVDGTLTFDVTLLASDAVTRAFAYHALPMRVVLRRRRAGPAARRGRRRRAGPGAGHLRPGAPGPRPARRRLLGDRVVGVLPEARMHVPVEVARRAGEVAADARRRLRRRRRRLGHRARQGGRARARRCRWSPCRRRTPARR